MKKSAAAVSLVLCAGLSAFAAADPIAAALAAPRLKGNARVARDNAANLVYEADAAADAAWLACADAAAVRRRQDEVRTALLASFGGLPARTPLNLVSTGNVPRNGYSVEKIRFESQPRHYVTAHLFKPDPAKFPGRRPGIVVTCGHSTNGKGADCYQRGAMQAALAGFVTLIYDPIDQGERRQSRKSETLWNVHAHNNLGRRAQLLGWNAARFRAWDGMRALDVLAACDNVDPERLGVMGHSGGGTMASWIMCLDDRIKCACPSGFLSTQRAVCEQCGPQDAEQFAFGSLAFGFNHLGHIALRAPSPVMLVCSHGDFFPYSGALDTARAAKRLYATLGAAEAFGRADTIGPHHWHESTRTASVDWMRRWLYGADALGGKALPPARMADYRRLQWGFSYDKVDCALGFEEKNLANMRTNRWEAIVTPTGSTLDLPGSRTVYDILRDELAAVGTPAFTAADVAALAGVDPEARARAEDVCGAWTDAAAHARGATLVGRDGTPVTVAAFGPTGAAAKTPVLIVSDARKPTDLAKRVREIVDAGGTACVAALRGFGETAAGARKFYGDPNGDEETAQLYALVGVNLVGRRAEDALVAARWFSDLCGGARPVLEAHGRAAIPAAHAYGVARGLFAGWRAERTPASWHELLADEGIACSFADVVNGALRRYDWTDLVK